jgi:cell division protein FtsW (lipid II flippase)
MKNPLPTILLVSVLIVFIAVCAGIPWGIGGVVFGLILASLSTVVIGSVISNHTSKKRSEEMALELRRTQKYLYDKRQVFEKIGLNDAGRGGKPVRRDLPQ